MANRHDVIIWDADVHGAPDGFTTYTFEKAFTLINQAAEPSKKLLAFARDVEKNSQSNAGLAQFFIGFEDRCHFSKSMSADCQRRCHQACLQCNL